MVLEQLNIHVKTINSNILNRKILEIKFLEDDIGKNIDNYGVR